ncbi:MAG TPA: hypothetical protein ACFYEC_04920 [Candidatus Brocadiaceae bacterium]
MSEEKGTSSDNLSSKKSVSSQKPAAQKPQKERLKSDVKTVSSENTRTALPLIKKISDIIEEIEKKPLKSYEKKEQEKILQSYEKLILKMVKEINNSRR